MQRKLFTKPSDDYADEPIIQEVIEVKQAPVQTGQILIRPTTPLSWKQSNLGVIKVQFNSLVKAWMNYDLSFANWVNSVLAVHAGQTNHRDTNAQLPDQFRDDIGTSITIMTMNDGVIHIMA